LNKADTYNHDHGDHMVQIFSLVQNAVTQKSEQPVAEQLNYASQVVEKEADSGSGKLYAQGLAKAAENFSGSELQPDTLGLLVKSLLNVEEPPQKKQETNFLGSLLSELTGKPDTSENDQKLGIDELTARRHGFLSIEAGRQQHDRGTDGRIDGHQSFGRFHTSHNVRFDGSFNHYGFR
jgi:hypothetical protein